MTEPQSRVDAMLAAVPEIDPADPLMVQAPSGMVAFSAIRRGSDGDQEWVEAVVGDPSCGDPSFRVINPPALVPDPDGDVEVAGLRYRYDPLASLAEVIASNGGSLVRKGR